MAKEIVWETVSLPERSPSNGDIILTRPEAGQRFYIVQSELPNNKLAVVPIVADDHDGFALKVKGARFEEIDKNSVFFVYSRKRTQPGHH